ncbi:NIPSNAP family protein [Nocardia sp. JMUB6875]|uniref:NIPSNAP family protein n=1 Tax=Nocardia sp. JMUB6875 TaxID=3158170 RepID=UPI0032E595DF
MTEILWPVLELRQYTLRPGTRDTLIDLFDRELLDPQEALGARMIGQFRDEDDPDRFVWLRAFPDMRARHAALAAFYLDSETWRTHAPAARATMVDTDDVLLLRPAPPGSGFTVPGERPGRDATAPPPARVMATVYHPSVDLDEFAAFFDDRVRPALAAADIHPIGVYATEPAPNTFAPLPVREGESAFTWFATFADDDQRAARLAALIRSPRWRDDLAPDLNKRLERPEQVLRLAPTARSLLR